ncbi:MAG: hypothetical protein ABIO39_14355 [Caulobacteraceae bacterium]
MKRTIDTTKLLFLGLFVAISAAAWVFQLWVIEPRKNCESGGGWWDPEGRVCAAPIYLPKLTGRPIRPKPPASNPPAAAPTSS